MIGADARRIGGSLKEFEETVSDATDAMLAVIDCFLARQKRDSMRQLTHKPNQMEIDLLSRPPEVDYVCKVATGCAIA